MGSAAGGVNGTSPSHVIFGYLTSDVTKGYSLAFWNIGALVIPLTSPSSGVPLSYLSGRAQSSAEIRFLYCGSLRIVFRQFGFDCQTSTTSTLH